MRWEELSGLESQSVVSWPPSLLLLTLGPSVVPKGPHGGFSLPLVAFLPLLIVKTQGNKDLFLTPPLVWQMFCKANSGGHSATCTASHLPWGHTLPHISPRMHCFCKWLDSSPAFTLQMQGGQGSARLQRSYWGVGMWWRGWEGYWVHR